MRQVLPVPLEVDDPTACYDAARPAWPDRPWVMLNMIATVDGATAIDGRSGALGGPLDRAVFSAVRAIPDVILAGAATVRAEGYGPARTSAELRLRRERRGQAPAPRIAVVTSALELDLDTTLFVESDEPPIIVTTERASPAALDRAAGVAEVVVAGEHSVDLAVALSALAGLGASVVLCEGGPSLNGQLLAAGMVDEVCLTVAPLLAGGSSPRIAHGPAGTNPTTMRLEQVLEQDGMLALRYVRT